MKDVQAVAELLRVLGDPTRLRLLAGLSHGELTVGEITEVTRLSQPRVSRHLKLLCDAQVLNRTRDQNQVYYRATIAEDRRGLVQEALASLPQDDPGIVKDRERLTSILDKRRAHARELLARMGVPSLSQRAATEVGDAIEKLLQTHLGQAAAVEELGDLLDVGTGTGSILRLLGGRARRAVAVDRSREMRLVARATVLSAGYANCSVEDGDMYSLRFPSGHFDIVTMDRALSAGDRPAEAIAEAARVLRQGGHLLVVETAGSPVQAQQLETWLRAAGLMSLEVQYTPSDAALVVLAGRIQRSDARVA